MSSSSPAFELREQCPGCRAQESTTLFECAFLKDPVWSYLERFYARHGAIERAPLQGATYRLRRCKGCGLVFQHEVPGPELTETLYERWIDPERDFELFRAAGSLERLSRYAGQIQTVVAYLGKPPRETKVLDFGLGWSRWARLAAAFECDVSGMELSSARLDRAHQLGIRTLDWHQLEAFRFDFIHTEQVFEHLAEPAETLTRLAGALAPYGLLKLSVPNGADLQRRLELGDWTAVKGSRHSLNMVSPLEHLNCFHRSALVRMAALAGLAPITLPLKLQWAFASCWHRPRYAARWNVAWPLYQNLLRRGTHLFFCHAETGGGGAPADG